MEKGKEKQSIRIYIDVCACMISQHSITVHSRYTRGPVVHVLCPFMQLFTGHVFKRTPRECVVVAPRGNMYEIRFRPFLLRVSLAATALPLIANVIGRSRAFHPSARFCPRWGRLETPPADFTWDCSICLTLIRSSIIVPLSLLRLADIK